MQLVTLDAIEFLPIPDLQDVVLRAIDTQASADSPDDPDKAAKRARDRKTIVLGAMNDLADYPSDQRAILMGFWAHFGGRS